MTPDEIRAAERVPALKAENARLREALAMPDAADAIDRGEAGGTTD